MDSSQPTDPPQRLSALYQYHNAPEVAPAHGLEYDDTIYPSSDKYPVVRERLSYLGKGGRYGFSGDNRPPRIIFGMKVRTFLCVAAVMIVIVVGAAVGGAVGGQQLREDQSQPTNFYSNTNGTVSSTTAASSTFSAPTPTYMPLSDCPASDNTTYTSSYAQGSSGTVPSDAGLKFTKYCDRQNPLSESGSQRIAEAFVYSFSDCVELCAGYNFWNNASSCNTATYQSAGTRPGNCWVGHAGHIQAARLNETLGIDVALLDA